MKRIILTMTIALALSAAADVKTFSHKTLVELFTSMSCTNCPTAHSIVNTVLDNRSDYAIIAHHAGYKDDELTNSWSTETAELFNVRANPKMMMDRRMHPGEPFRSFSVSVNNADAAVMLLTKKLNDTPHTCNVGVTVKPVFHIPGRTLTVKVKLERNEDLDPRALLTVVLTEDNVKTTGKQVAVEGDEARIQNHVLRHSFTGTMGEAIDWVGDKYTKTFTLQLPDDWNLDNLSAVAYVNLPASDEQTDTEVFNTEIATDIPTSDEAYDPDKIDDDDDGDDNGDDNGNSAVESATVDLSEATYYNMQGIRVANPVAGQTYIIVTPMGFAKKVVILQSN